MISRGFLKALGSGGFQKEVYRRIAVAIGGPPRRFQIIARDNRSLFDN